MTSAAVDEPPLWKRCLFALILGALVLSPELMLRALRYVARAPADSAYSFALYGVGESTMLGTPFDDSVSPLHLVSTMFRDRVGSRPIRLHNLAEAGWSIYPESVVFERAVAFRDRSIPGAVLIYAGHNEGLLPPEVGDTAAGWIDRFVLASHSWVLRDVLFALRSRHIVERAHGLRNYERFLRHTIRVALDAGLTPILATLPSNIVGVEPNDPPGEEDPKLQEILEAGLALEGAGKYADAEQAYRDALKNIHVGELQLRYRAALCSLAAGRFDAARDQLLEIVDRDIRSNFGRATRPQNDLVRTLAAEYRIPLVDAAEAFMRAAPHGIPGNELFSDGHHPNLEGYVLLATGYGRALAEATDEPGERIANADELRAAARPCGKDERKAHRYSGSWLLATAAYHPWPHDRMLLAEMHFKAAMDGIYDFSSLLGLALAQSARSSALLRNREVVDLLGRNSVYYRRDAFEVSPEDWARLLPQLTGADPTIMSALEALRPPATDHAQR